MVKVLRSPVFLLVGSLLFIAGCGGDGVNPLSAQPSTGRSNPAANRTTETLALTLITPTLATEPVTHDSDDPAIWVNPTAPEKSLIIGTDKHEQTGGLFVFNLEGKVVQKIENLDRPNNVDVVTGFQMGSEKVDLVVATERKKNRLLIYRIDPQTLQLVDVTGQTAVFTERKGIEAEVMGVALYKRPKDQAVFAIVSPKTGPKEGYLGQFRLVANGAKVDVRTVRRFGLFSGLTPTEEGEIEAITVDQDLGLVYFADELKGIRKGFADPDARNTNSQVAIFGEQGYIGDREGLAIYRKGAGGWLLSTDQIEAASEIRVYERGTAATKANRLVAVLKTQSDTTDGIEVTNQPLGAKFPNGILVMMNSKDRNFHIYDWRRVEQAITQASQPVTRTPANPRPR
ncbi:MAG: phytase [Fimbriimonadaceae bacterium]|jgi:3-phytase|nr:phytase [Fimbriimonadaceae bacterium]